jgi:antitoxin FitA
MKTLEINLSEETASKLDEAAEKLGITAEDLLVISVKEKLARLEEDFRSAAEYVINKNDELYKRLA